MCIYVYGEIVMNGYDKLSMDMTMVLCMGKVYGTDCMGKVCIKFQCENVDMYSCKNMSVEILFVLLMCINRMLSVS